MMICPCCIIEMKKQTRKTKRGKRIFMVCAHCGYNEQLNVSICIDEKETIMFKEMKEKDLTTNIYEND